jgi:hypothetical protein
MKRSHLKRKKALPKPTGYLKRKTPLRRSSPKAVAAKRARAGLADPAYLKWIRKIPCIAPSCGAKHRVQPHHMTGGQGEQRRGMSQKVHDVHTLPLCSRHHRAFHAGKGIFAGWNKEVRRRWQAAWIKILNGQYQEHQDQVFEDLFDGVMPL